MSTNAPRNRSPLLTPGHSRATRFFLAGSSFLAALATSLTFSLSTSAHQLPGPAATPPPTNDGPEQSVSLTPIGYRGQATNTNELPDAWASGAATAWTLPTGDVSHLPARLIAEGSTLYVLTYGSGSEAVTTVSAYDVSGSEPVNQWSTTGPQPSRIRAEAFPSSVSTSEEILLSGIIVDRSTGTQTEAPWGSDLPMGVAGGVLVTCDTFSSCSGWSHDSGAWRTLWSTQTSPQRRAGLAHSGLTRPTTAVVGSGAGAAVVVPVDRAGWGLDRLPTSDREVPSVADLSSFLTQGSAPWTTGTVERPYPNDDYSYTMVAVSTSGESYRIKPGESFPEMPEYNTWHAAQVRASAEGNALYIQGVPSAQRRAFFFNMSRDMTYVLPRLDDATNVVWVFDDLLVGTSNGAVVAFTPARQ